MFTLGGPQRMRQQELFLVLEQRKMRIYLEKKYDHYTSHELLQIVSKHTHDCRGFRTWIHLNTLWTERCTQGCELILGRQTPLLIQILPNEKHK